MAMRDLGDGAEMNIEPFSERFELHPTGTKRADFQNVGFSELGHSVSGSFRPPFRVSTRAVRVAARLVPTTFTLSVSGVVGIGSKEKVIRIDARWIVACVADAKSARLHSCAYKIGDAVGTVPFPADLK